ncbi:MAG: hypothetical protein U0J90_04465 [Streptococcus salivarius]|nr:hypothetical protein [Streptococcus salivarius]
MNWRIVTGYYITALGQESERYYFKTTNETIKVGDVGLTFYQNGEIITAIPALIRIEYIRETEVNENEFLEQEVTDHIPYLPVIEVYESFSVDLHNRLEDFYSDLKDEIKELADVNYVQGSIFDFMEDS